MTSSTSHPASLSAPSDTVTMVLTLLDVDFGLSGLSPDTDLLAEGLLDSLAIMELILALEQTFAIALDEDTLVPDNFASAAAMSRLISGDTP